MKVLFNTSFYCTCLDEKFEAEWKEVEETKPGWSGVFGLEEEWGDLI